MTTYTAADLATKSLSSIDQAAIYFGTIQPGVNTATGDILRPCKLPGGFKLAALMINVRTAFASTAPAKIGYSHVDGSTPYNANPDTIIAAATDTSHASVGNKLVLPQGGAFYLGKDSFLEIVFGTIATAAQGVADYVVLGEFVGTK